MNNEQILKKAINKAVINGWKWGEAVSDSLFGKNGVYVENAITSYSIIFTHDFAKAFWGDDINRREITDEIGTTYFMARNDWTYHLQQMVLEENPIKYLEKFITK